MNKNPKSIESDYDNTVVRSHLEQQIRNQEAKDNGSRIDNIDWLTTYFYKTTGKWIKFCETSIKIFSCDIYSKWW